MWLIFSWDRAVKVYQKFLFLLSWGGGGDDFLI